MSEWCPKGTCGSGLVVDYLLLHLFQCVLRDVMVQGLSFAYMIKHYWRTLFVKI